MDRQTIQRNGLVNFLTLLLLGGAVFAAGRYANALTGQVAAIFFGIGALIAFVSWFQMRLEAREAAEQLELEELARTRSRSALFESKETAFLPAQRARQTFEKYFVTGFMVVLLLVELTGTILLWRGLNRADYTGVDAGRVLVALGLFGGLALILFMRGRFAVTLARLESNRLLRPAANFVLLGAYLCAVTLLALLGDKIDFPRADFVGAKLFTLLLGLLALEHLVTLVLELYRPRLKNRIARPLYDSRLVGLLAQPEGLVATAAQTLDYQFGFKVSDTWFFRVLKEKLPAIVLIQLAALLLSSCFIFIEAGEEAVVERFGKPTANGRVLGPGAHLKWPWPIDVVYRYNTQQIQTLRIGSTPKEEDAEHKVVLWNVSHVKEEVNYLVANRSVRDTPAAPAGPDHKKVPPVSLLTTSIPIQYQITNITEWIYGHESSSNALLNVATREVVRFLVSVDTTELMSTKREASAHTLARRIQAAATQRALGVKILHVGLQDVHPPVKVAPEYQKVVAAIQQKQAKIVAAEGDAIMTNAWAGAQATVITNTAEADRLNQELITTARAAAFTNQIPAFRAAPSVYKQRLYAQAFPRATAEARKYLLVTTNTDNVIIFDLQHSAVDNMIQQQAEAILNSK
ncbi:MAG TPA: SPFH domain-containing protein [Verrucomicrobiota bacterium]|nr:SPFH domain-containing protein [Verrucomicrobiota bacterium]HNT13634.1 SPFH domain-containing protein [Verrucomicrobiota bacterium]